MQSLTFSGLGWKGLVNTKGILIHLILECSHFLMGWREISSYSPQRTLLTSLYDPSLTFTPQRNETDT